jgi:hypothetical protein
MARRRVVTRLSRGSHESVKFNLHPAHRRDRGFAARRRNGLLRMHGVVPCTGSHE